MGVDMPSFREGQVEKIGLKLENTQLSRALRVFSFVPEW